MKSRLVERAGREYSPKQRLVTLFVAGIFFLAVLPALLYILSGVLDPLLRLARLDFGLLNLILGLIMIVSGWFFGIWSVYVQFTLGRGTPVPVMATQRLIVEPPYTYCRNPMTLGTIVLYLGESVLLGSISAAVLVLLGATLLLAYIKRTEEDELAARFGEDYLAYKERTPFLIPRFRN